MRRSGWRAVLTALTIAAALVVTSCGDDESDSGGGSGQATQEEERPKIKVGLVTDIGGLNDPTLPHCLIAAMS